MPRPRVCATTNGVPSASFAVTTALDDQPSPNSTMRSGVAVPRSVPVRKRRNISRKAFGSSADSFLRQAPNGAGITLRPSAVHSSKNFPSSPGAGMTRSPPPTETNRASASLVSSERRRTPASMTAEKPPKLRRWPAVVTSSTTVSRRNSLVCDSPVSAAISGLSARPVKVAERFISGAPALPSTRRTRRLSRTGIAYL